MNVITDTKRFSFLCFVYDYRGM